MIISETTTVADIVAGLPSSVRVLQRYGIDFCCGARMPLAAACDRQGVAAADVVHAIEAVAAQPSQEDRDWTREPLAALIDHIIATYHNPLREELPRLESMAAKVRGVHGTKAPQLDRLEAIVSELSAELRRHMTKEEMVLFPVIRTLEGGKGRPPVSLSAPIAVMEGEHDHAGGLLAELRAITEGYRPPAWACATFRALYQGLSELESEMHLHVHLENNILFPRALRLTGATP
jgi:regulator of cell morphogenesis and NO signaling